MLAIMQDVAENDYWEEWRTIRQPTLVVGGANSKVVDQSILDSMARAIRNGQFVSVEGAGHDVHLDRPMAWMDAITAFIDRVEPGNAK